MFTSEQLRQKFADYWKQSPRNHKEITGVSLVPEVDSTLLFVNSGMFPLAPYLAGQSHPMGKRLFNIQRCLRTKYDEWMEVGDNRHTLMFEMMGNWSLGDFSKQEQIPWMLELYTEVFGLDPSRLFVSVWGGNNLVKLDSEAIEIWKAAFQKHGIVAEFSEDISKIPPQLNDDAKWKYHIFPYTKPNWWQRGEAKDELGGPTTELFYDTGNVEKKQDRYHINDDSGRFIEVGNSVFMEYFIKELSSDGVPSWNPLSQKNIDFGGGFERAVMCHQGKLDIFETDIYVPIVEKVEQISGQKYSKPETQRFFRIIADHARASTFLLADGVLPSNKDQGYILRRFIRRLVRIGMQLGIERDFSADVATSVITKMKSAYPHLETASDTILNEISKEEGRFRSNLKKGMKELRHLVDMGNDEIDKKIDGEKAFYLYESYGFPLEMIVEELGLSDPERLKLEEAFKNAMQSHREKSRAGAVKKFKGGLSDHSVENTRYHTVTHILLKALQTVLGDHVHQAGSNITPERVRLDITHKIKLTPEQIAQVEDIVNSAINEELDIEKSEMPLDEAKKIGAEGVFEHKYGDTVSVYKIWNKETGRVFSLEICGGPHIQNTRELKTIGKFKIIKEEGVGAGARRLKAVLIS